MAASCWHLLARCTKWKRVKETYIGAKETYIQGTIIVYT